LPLRIRLSDDVFLARELKVHQNIFIEAGVFVELDFFNSFYL